MGIGRRWPPYGSNFTAGATDAIGILVETYNDLEMALQFILLTLMRGDVLMNMVVTEQMSSLAIIEAIKAYVAKSPKQRLIQASIDFAISSFETCRTNRNSIVHFRMAWRHPAGRKTYVMRVKARGGRFSLTRTLKVTDIRRIADDCHALRVYLDDLSVALDTSFNEKAYIEPKRPNKSEVLAWAKAPYL
jgi:hypothetical protein